MNKRRKIEEEARKKKQMITKIVIATISGGIALIVIGYFIWNALQPVGSSNANSTTNASTSESVLSYTEGNYSTTQVEVVSKVTGEKITLNGFEGLEANCVTYALRRLGYSIPENVWINPDEIGQLLEMDFDSNIKTTTVAWIVVENRINTQAPEGSLVVIYVFEDGVEIPQHVAYVQADKLLAQKFGFLDAIEILKPADALARLVDERADIMDAHTEIWTPKGQ